MLRRDQRIVHEPRDDGLHPSRRGGAEATPGTPLPATSLFGGLLLNSLVVAAVLTAILLSIAVAFFDVTFPGHWGALVVSLIVGTAAFCALGVAVAAVIPHADAAPAIVNGILFPILFVSGVFFPVQDDSVLTRIGDIFPVRHFVNAVFARSTLASRTGLAHGWNWGDLAIVAAVGRRRGDRRRPQVPLGPPPQLGPRPGLLCCDGGLMWRFLQQRTGSGAA